MSGIPPSRKRLNFKIPAVSSTRSFGLIPLPSSSATVPTIPLIAPPPTPRRPLKKRKRNESNNSWIVREPATQDDDIIEDTAGLFNALHTWDDDSGGAQTIEASESRVGAGIESVIADSYTVFEDAALSSCMGFYVLTPNLCIVEGWNVNAGSATVCLALRSQYC